MAASASLGEASVWIGCSLMPHAGARLTEFGSSSRAGSTVAPWRTRNTFQFSRAMLVFIKAFRATGMRTQRGCSRPHPTAYQPPDGQHSGKAVEVNRTGEPGAAVRGRPTPSRHATRMMMLGMLDRDWAVSSSASPRCS